MFGRKPLLASLLTSLALPAFAAVEHYQIDPEHSFPNFEFSHMNISIWRGKFNKTSGHITLDRAAKTGRVEIKVDPASINFGLASMDDMARSESFFNVKKFPSASYTGKIKFDGDKPKSIEGEITLLGITRPLTLDINLFNCIPHPMLKQEVCGADASGEVNWSEYGMQMSQYGEGEAGKVRLNIQVEALKQEKPNHKPEEI